MKFLCISDIHSQFPRFAPDALPPADVVLVAGDLTNCGKRNLLIGYGPVAKPEWPEAQEWLCAMGDRYPAVFWVPGNHDMDVSEKDNPDHPHVRCIFGRGSNVVTPAGSFSICGTSLSPCFNSPGLAKVWDHMTASERADDLYHSLIPEVDIVVSHCPPFGVRDRGPYGDSLGSPGLRKRLLSMKKKPRFLVCGHIHEGVGVGELDGIKVFNTACGWVVVEVDFPAEAAETVLEPETVTPVATHSPAR